MNTDIENPNADPTPANPPPTANGRPGPEPALDAEIPPSEAQLSTLNHQLLTSTATATAKSPASPNPAWRPISLNITQYHPISPNITKTLCTASTIP